MATDSTAPRPGCWTGCALEPGFLGSATGNTPEVVTPACGQKFAALSWVLPECAASGAFGRVQPGDLSLKRGLMNIVFDLGAVLLTWRPAQLMQQTFPQQANTPEAARQLAHQVFGHPDWHEFDRGVLEPEAVIERAAKRLDLPPESMRQLVHGIGERLIPMHDTVAVLEQLSVRRQTGDGVSGLYYLSNMPVLYARVLQQRYQFLQCFDGGIFSGDVKYIKPDPAIYQLLQSRYALEPANTVFVDDLKGNVEQAKALGWQGIHFESTRQLQTALSTLGL